MPQVLDLEGGWAGAAGAAAFAAVAAHQCMQQRLLLGATQLPPHPEGLARPLQHRARMHIRSGLQQQGNCLIVALLHSCLQRMQWCVCMCVCVCACSDVCVSYRAHVCVYVWSHVQVCVRVRKWQLWRTGSRAVAAPSPFSVGPSARMTRMTDGCLVQGRSTSPQRTPACLSPHALPAPWQGLVPPPVQAQGCCPHQQGPSAPAARPGACCC